MLKIAVVGASGRMGRSIIRLAEDSKTIRLVGALVRQGSPADDRPVLGWPDLLYTSDMAAALAEADVALDFSVASSGTDLVRFCVDQDLPLLVGTTGLEPKVVNALKKAGERIPVLLAPNTSMGVNLLFKLAQQAATALGEDYDIEIVEAHHGRKVDAPSGTALRLGEEVASARKRSLKADGVFERHGQTGARKRGEIGFSVIRGGDIAGEHTVYLAGPGEQIELTHRASSRDTFANGALDAAGWLAKQRPGFYDMADRLGL